MLNVVLFTRSHRLLLGILFAVLLPLCFTGTAQAQSIDDGLVGYWPFDADNPSVDQSGNGNTATLNSGLQLTTDVAPTAFANTRALLSAPNPNNYAIAPGNGIDNLTDYTVAFWIRVNSAATGTGDVLALGNRLVIQVRKLQSGLFILDVRSPLRLFPYPVEAVLESNGWNHVVVTLQGNETNIYFNGQRVQNETYGAGYAGTPTNGLTFSSPNTPLNGILDDIRIYNRVLNASEIAALPYNCNNAQGVPAGECQALVNLFRNTDGMKWTNHTNWLGNNSPCTWFGILCNNGHVFALSLPQNNLRGVLPTALGDLPELTVLQLPNNQLAGTLPFELGNLSKLQTLDLYGNQLSGQMPFTLGNLRKLTTLRLYNNQLRGAVPQQLTNLTNLLTLDLGYNMLTADVPTLVSFLNSKQSAWAATQTLPPTNLKASVQSSTSISLTWMPISYTADAGTYEVFSTTQTSGLYTAVGKTTNKSANGFLVDGLTSGQSYSFLVRTFTPKHDLQQNDLLSDSTDPVAITLNPPPLPATITIMLDVQPDSKTNVSFAGSGGAFKLDDITPQDGDAYSNSKSFTVPAGVYTVTAALPPGYLDANISCNPPTGTIADLTKHQLVINAAAGANLTCTFAVQRAGQIIAGKYNDRNHNHARNKNEEWLNGWQMGLYNRFGGQLAAQSTSGEGRTVFTNLFAGSYTVCETQQSGWFAITPNTVNPTYNAPCYTVTVAPGQAVWVRFGNSNTPLVVAAEATPIEDIVVCDLPATDDDGNELTAERDPWEEEEQSISNPIFLPLVQR